MSELTPEQRDSVEGALAAGRKIEAIKIYREATGLDLKHAKDEVEELLAQLREQQPERFTRMSTSGCASVLLIGVAVVAAGIGILAIMQ